MPASVSLSDNDNNQAQMDRKSTRNFLGKRHTELADWLSQTWLVDGPPICFLQGFPGVGKTFLARDLLKTLNFPRVMVTMSNSGESNQIDDLFLDLATELDLIGSHEMAHAVDNGISLHHALEKILSKQVLIVIDEFQQALDQSGKPISQLASTLDHIANRLYFPGRMLLLSNRVVEQGKWSEAYAVKTLKALEGEAAELLLDRRLKEIDRSAEVPLERRRDVVNWLGRNPRAIHVLVGSLKYESLDDLIGLNPESWDLREREVSPELLYRLELELLERTLSHLKTGTRRLLHRLSVYRKPIIQKGIEVQLPARADIIDVRNDLISRFLMEYDTKWYTLHPIVKEISLQELKGDVTELRQAHIKAADYYTRHFIAKNIVGSGQLGGYFVEARYHLVQAKHERDLTDIAERFGNHLKSTFKKNFSFPAGPDERDETIAVLSALLNSTSDSDLEYHLASLYKDRGTSSDLQKALIYVTRATDIGTEIDSWKLRIQLERELNGLEQALQAFRKGIDRVPADCLVEFYRHSGQVIAQLLVQANKREEAIVLLQEGITRFPTNAYTIEIYRQCGELLVQAERYAEAIILFQEGIERFPSHQGTLTLYRVCGKLLAQEGKPEQAAQVFRESIDRVPADRLVEFYRLSGRTIAQSLAQANKREEAIVFLQEGIARFPTNAYAIALYRQCGELLVQLERYDEAIILSQEGIARFPNHGGVLKLYRSCGELLVQTGRSDEAITLLQAGIASFSAEGGHGEVGVLYRSCGELLVQTGRSEEAITLLQAGIELLPTEGGHLAALYRSCGELLVQKGKPDAAITLLREGTTRLSAEGGYVGALYQSCGEILVQTGRPEEAIILLQEGIARVPVGGGQVGTLYRSCGEILAQMGRAEEAIILLQEGIARVPTVNKVMLYQSYGEILAQTGKSEEAITLLQESIERLSTVNTVTLYQSCGEILTQAGKPEAAITLLQEGIERLPTVNSALLYQSCGEILTRVGKPEEAIMLLQEGIAYMPASVILYQSCGEILAQTGKVEEAIALLQEGIIHVPLGKSRSNLYIFLEQLMIL